jgi:hypothetical protein
MLKIVTMTCETKKQVESWESGGYTTYTIEFSQDTVYGGVDLFGNSLPDFTLSTVHKSVADKFTVGNNYDICIDA